MRASIESQSIISSCFGVLGHFLFSFSTFCEVRIIHFLQEVQQLGVA